MKYCFVTADSKFRDLRMRGQFDEMLFCYCRFKVWIFADAWVLCFVIADSKFRDLRMRG